MKCQNCIKLQKLIKKMLEYYEEDLNDNLRELKELKKTLYEYGYLVRK